MSHMKICFVFLVDYKIHNYARKYAFDINARYKTGLVAAVLPQHITLGPPFEINNLAEAEKYFDSLAKTIQPFEVFFARFAIKIVPDGKDGHGILWMDLKECTELRGLHLRVYKELKRHGWCVEPLPGGEEYHFHSTIALGGQPGEVYQEMYNDMTDKEINLSSHISEIAMMCPVDDSSSNETYITYKILPLGV